MVGNLVYSFIDYIMALFREDSSQGQVYRFAF